MQARRHSLARYLPSSVDLYTHFHIIWGTVHRGFARLPCLLARAWADGRFELISPAWRDLGYSEAELAGRGVCDLMSLDAESARNAVRTLLTEGGALELELQCREDGARRYRWNRQFDDYTTSMFIIADELPSVTPQAEVKRRIPAKRGPGVLAARAA